MPNAENCMEIGYSLIANSRVPKHKLRIVGREQFNGNGMSTAEFCDMTYLIYYLIRKNPGSILIFTARGKGPT